MASEDSATNAAFEQCQLPDCDNERLVGAHYCCPEHEAKASREGIKVTGAPSEVYDG